MDAKTQENLRKHGGFAFDFGDIKDDQKKAIEEAIKYLQEKGVDKGTLEDLKLKLDDKGNIKADFKDFKTSEKKVFAAGDSRRGQSLVVWAIREGREAAESIDKFLS